MNLQQIKQEILDKFPDSNLEYLEKYLEICSNDDTDEYTEAHHILPKAKSAWPMYSSFKENSWNCVKLNRYNHFMAHYWFSLSTDQLWVAIKMMSGTLLKLKALSDTELHDIAKIYETHKSVKPSIETRRKMSLTRRGKTHTEDTKLKIKLSNTGQKRTETTKINISNSLIGKPCSDLRRAAISKSGKGIRVGIKLSDCTKRKMKLAKLGKHLSEEHKKSCEAAARKSLIWQEPLYSELYNIWLSNGGIMSGYLFRKFIIDLGYPDLHCNKLVLSFIKKRG